MENPRLVSASLQKVKSIKNPIKHFFNFNFIKSETSDSFVSHFDGHFAYLKTLDFYFSTFSRGSDPRTRVFVPNSQLPENLQSFLLGHYDFVVVPFVGQELGGKNLHDVLWYCSCKQKSQHVEKYLLVLQGGKKRRLSVLAVSPRWFQPGVYLLVGNRDDNDSVVSFLALLLLPAIFPVSCTKQNTGEEEKQQKGKVSQQCRKILLQGNSARDLSPGHVPFGCTHLWREKNVGGKTLEQNLCFGAVRLSSLFSCSSCATVITGIHGSKQLFRYITPHRLDVDCSYNYSHCLATCCGVQLYSHCLATSCGMQLYSHCLATSRGLQLQSLFSNQSWIVAIVTVQRSETVLLLRRFWR